MRTVGLLAALVAGLVIYLVSLQLTGNVHVVIPGELYRSAQPTGDTLRRMVAQHGIRSVVNLRGAKPGAGWYDEEVETARALCIDPFDFRMSESEHMASDRADKLLTMLRNAPKPLLIHCQAGADRTGLVSSLYLTAMAGGDEETAERQLSLIYGHISWPYLSAAWPMNEIWEALEPWLGFDAS